MFGMIAFEQQSENDKNDLQLRSLERFSCALSNDLQNCHMCVNKVGGGDGTMVAKAWGGETEWALIRLHTPIHDYILTDEWPKFLTNWKCISRFLNVNLISNSELSSLWIKLFA